MCRLFRLSEPMSISLGVSIIRSYLCCKGSPLNYTDMEKDIQIILKSLDRDKTIELCKDVQFENSLNAVLMYETLQGGLDPIQAWQGTEDLRVLFHDTAPDRRADLVQQAWDDLIKKYQTSPNLTNNPVRSAICVSALFSLRLVRASVDQEANPNNGIISGFVGRIGDIIKQNDEMNNLFSAFMQQINKDGDINEAKGKKIPFGENILDQEVVRESAIETKEQPKASTHRKRR